MADLPILPLKTDAILADTIQMSAEEFGAYCRILFTLWLHGGRLPHDMKQLRRIAGVSPRRWGRIKDAVTRPLTIADGFVSQKRLTSTRLNVQEMRRKRAVAGIAGMRSRWKNDQKGTHHEQIIQFPKPLK